MTHDPLNRLARTFAKKHMGQTFPLTLSEGDIVEFGRQAKALQREADNAKLERVTAPVEISELRERLDEIGRLLMGYVMTCQEQQVGVDSNVCRAVVLLSGIKAWVDSEQASEIGTVIKVGVQG